MSAQGQRNSTATRPKIKLPDDYDSEAEFLKDMRDDFAEDTGADTLNRAAGIEDLAFTIGTQWNTDVRVARESARKPTLTINRIPAFLGQIIGQRRQSETVINVLPDNGGTQAIAAVRKGLIRSIEKISRADIAYDKALEGCAACGIGNFQVEVDWNPNDVWNQDIKISPINDHFSVVWDRNMTDPSGRDAGHWFVVDVMTQKDFYKTWPWATPADIAVDYGLNSNVITTGWVIQGNVRIANYWRMRTRKRWLALMNDGTTQDITDKLDDPETSDATLANVVQRPEDGSPIMREAEVRFAEMYVCSGTDILEGPYQLPVDRPTAFRVPGWEMQVGDQKHRWGLVRFLKDPQRLHNFWRSVLAEKLMQSPRAVWAAADTAVNGRENEWRQSHLTDDPLLIWNSESGQKPERIPPAQLENALLTQAEITTQDLKDVSNIHEANLGMPSNEVSGVAIQARQRVSDTGTVLYHDNLNAAIEECGRVINQLIPVVYDTPRMVKVIGDDAQEYMQVINATGDPSSIDLSIGRYSVTVTTGASYATKRQEAAASMEALASAMPQAFVGSADLLVDAMDWPGKEKIVERLRKQMPPGILSPNEMTPAIQASAAAQQQAQAQAQQAGMAKAVADFQKTQSETTLNNSRASNYEAQAQSIPIKDQNQSISTASQAADRELRGHLDAIKTATGG